MKKRMRTAYLVLLDIFLVNLSLYLSFYLRFDGNISKEYFQMYLDNFIVLTIVKVVIFVCFKLYNCLWEYASIEELVQVVAASMISNITVFTYLFITRQNLPRSIFILTTMIDIFLIGGIRFSYRTLRRAKNNNYKMNVNDKRVMIIGAGDAGAMIIREIKNHRQLNSKPIVIIDDDQKKLGKRIHGIPVLGNRQDIATLTKKFKINEIIIAIPSASKKDIREIVSECKRTKCQLKKLPGIFEIIDGKVRVNDIRDVQIEDLLGREEVKLNIEEISEYLRDKKILVTGGGGSIGSELCRQIVRFSPRELVIFDIYENNAYELQNELKRIYNLQFTIDNEKQKQNSKDKGLNLRVVIASVRDRVRMDEVMESLKPDVVFHAAAHKYVPFMEDNPKEAVKNNILGTLNVAQSADNYGVKKFVMISTDKAVNPTNIMGASKRVCEMIVQSMDKISKTEFVAVRFGNVLGSNGSVIPLFKKQIAEGGPVTVTHPEVTRYFMTIPEASQLVIQAGAMAKGGEIFVLDMGEPIKIIDLAKDLIRLSGFIPYRDIQIKNIGLREGEKLFEELFLDEEEISLTRHEKIFVCKSMFLDYKLLLSRIETLKDMINTKKDEYVKKCILQMVSTNMSVFNDLEDNVMECRNI